jgi:hypothetical protein
MENLTSNSYSDGEFVSSKDTIILTQITYQKKIKALDEGETSRLYTLVKVVGDNGWEFRLKYKMNHVYIAVQEDETKTL